MAALQPGLNIIEVTAFDAEGNAESDSLAVTYLPPPLALEVLGVVGGVFRFQVSGPAGSTIAVQRSGDFNQWESLGSRTLSLHRVRAFHPGGQAGAVRDRAFKPP